MEEKEIQDKLEKGGIRASAIIEVLGHPKEHVDSTLKKIVESIQERKEFDLLNDKTFPAKEAKEMFSAFTELDVLFKDVSSIIAFCFDFMPSSIEITHPEQFQMKCTQASELFNELQARLHQVDMIAKQKSAESKILKKKLSGLINYIILYNLRTPKTLEELKEDIGIEGETVAKLVEAFEQQGKIKKEKDKYKTSEGIKFSK